MLLQQLEIRKTVLFLFLTDLWVDFSAQKKKKKKTNTLYALNWSLEKSNTFLSIDVVIYKELFFWLL